MRLRLYTVGSDAMMKCEKRKWQSLSYRMATKIEMKKKWTCQHFNAYLMHKQYVLMSETLGFAQQTHPLTVEAGGYLVDVLSLHKGRDSLGCSVLPRLSMLDSYVCVGSVLCNGMNRDMRKSLSGRKGHFITYIDQNLQLHLMPPPQNVSPVDTIILMINLFRGTMYLAEGIYLSSIKPRPSIDPYNCHDFLENTGVVS